MKLNNNNFKVLNSFFAKLRFTSKDFIKLSDLENIHLDEQSKITPFISYLSDFNELVRNECVLNRKFFSLFDIPDLIIKKKISRKDYSDKILKLLKRVKKTYLKEKRLTNKDAEITDDDLIPLSILDEVLASIKNKMQEKVQTIQKFIKES